MSLRYFYRPSWRSGDPAVEFTDHVRLYTLDVTENAEEGSVATSNIDVDDTFGALDFPPLTRIWAYDTEVSSSSNTYVFHGYIGPRTVKRGPSHLTGTARVWSVSVLDENSVLSRRILSNPNANRPAETDVQRVQWLANEADGQLLIDDTTFLNTSSPVNMDAVDYRGQTGLEVLNDCAEASGKNFYAYFNQNAGTGIWYGAEDLTTHTSMVRLSNDIADIDNATTFAIGDGDATYLERDPSRLASSVYYQYARGNIYVRNQTSFNRFGLRDVPMSSLNVKTEARAQARANRLLADLDTESDRIYTTVYLPASKVTWIKAGMRLRFKATHLPGYEDFAWLRVYACGVAQVSEEQYLLTLVLGTGSIPADPAPDTSPASAIMWLPTGDGGTGSFGIEPEVRWQGTGDTPPTGYPLTPKQGSLEYVTDGLVATYPNKGFRALGSGDLAVTFSADDIAGVVGTVNCVASITKNGSVIASSAHSTDDHLAPGFPYGHSTAFSVSTTVSVVNGDVLSCQFTSTWGNMKVPAATGETHRFQVSGDLT